MPSKLSLPVAVIFFLVVCGPAEGWYKQVASPSYYSVGRASGLLSGIRRSQLVRRDESTESGESATNSLLSGWISHNSIFKTMPVCVRHITPNLQSCEISQEIKGSLKCKADIFLSLDSSDCGGD